MRFVKASERLPEAAHPPYLVIVRWWANGEHLRVSALTPNQLADALKWATLERHEWLDESTPASAVEEAARLYPYPDESEYDEYAFEHLKERQESRRQAHITCAGMYTGEIEKLKNLIHDAWYDGFGCDPIQLTNTEMQNQWEKFKAKHNL